MSFLVRKIMRSSSESILKACPKTNLKNITSDVTTNEFRSSNSELSVWKINTLEDLDDAALAIVLGGQKFEDFKLMVVDSGIIEGNFEIKKSPGSTAAIPLIDMHRDICGITHGSLDILLGAYKDAVEQGLCKRYKTKQLRELVRTALSEGIVDIEGANEGLVEDIRELQVS